MVELTEAALARFITARFGATARLVACGRIADIGTQGMKEFGYGKPLLVRYEVGGETREAVLSTMRGDKYGHQFWWDRAAVLMFQHETSGLMERHARPLGMGYIDGDGELRPVVDCREFFILNEKVAGHDYYLDLERIRGGDLRPDDLKLAKELALWLARVHAEKKDDPDLYYRRVRELLGSSECIMGLVDEAFPHPWTQFSDERFLALEKRLVDWRWKLKGYSNRLCAVHGDFHPWNVLVTDDGQFSLLDRSRGQWGEPAGDLACMAVNYLLFGLYDEPRLSGSFERLYKTYFETYLAETDDAEVLEVIAPFFVFRGLVIASPEWYPRHPPAVRQGLLAFIENVLEEGRFDWEHINRYMG